MGRASLANAHGELCQGTAFRQYAERFERLYLENQETRLSAINRGGWRRCARYWTDEPGYRGRWTTTIEGRTERLVSICQQAGADCYVSGPTARAYVDATASAPPASGLEHFDYAGYPSMTSCFRLRPLRERDRFDLQSRPSGCRLHAASVTMRLSIVTTLSIGASPGRVSPVSARPRPGSPRITRSCSSTTDRRTIPRRGAETARA